MIALVHALCIVLLAMVVVILALEAVKETVLAHVQKMVVPVAQIVVQKDAQVIALVDVRTDAQEHVIPLVRALVKENVMDALQHVLEVVKTQLQVHAMGVQAVLQHVKVAPHVEDHVILHVVQVVHQDVKIVV